MPGPHVVVDNLLIIFDKFSGMAVAKGRGVTHYLSTFDPGLGMGIGVLLGGGAGDRYAVPHAIALAQRTGEVVHGIRREPSLPHPNPAPSAASESGLTLLMQRADAAGVAVRCHVLEGGDPKDFRALLREQRIFYLIVGASDEEEGRRAEKQLEALRRSVASDRRWSMRSFWAVVMGPWSEGAMDTAFVDDKTVS